jgi:hypothetical protein
MTPISRERNSVGLWLERQAATLEKGEFPLQVPDGVLSYSKRGGLP